MFVYRLGRIQEGEEGGSDKQTKTECNYNHYFTITLND